MDCVDTLGVICTFLSKRDILEVGKVSRLSRSVARELFTMRERLYYVGACVKEGYVELAPPSQILAVHFCEQENRMLVLTRNCAETVCVEDVECTLYIQQSNADGNQFEVSVPLPIYFGLPTSLVQFEGDRFLCCTSKDDEAFVFDCTLQVLLELPHAFDSFHASPDGTRFSLDYDQKLYCGDTASCIHPWWEMAEAAPERPTYGVSPLVPSKPVATRLRAALKVERAAWCRPLGHSSSAWRSTVVGRSAVLHMDEVGVVLLRDTAAAAPDPPALLHSSKSAEDCDPLLYTEALLGSLAPASTYLSLSSRTAVVSDADTDLFAIFDCKEQCMHVIKSSPSATQVESFPHMRDVLPPRVVIQGVGIAVPGRTYALFTQHQQVDRVLFFSADLTLQRWVTVGKPSAMSLVGSQGMLITAPLPVPNGEHPLLEVFEGGFGTIFTFDEPPRASASTASVTVAPEADAAHAPKMHELPWGYAMLDPTFSGVGLLSWIAFGVVSASLCWTVSALCYNGWWLHLQLLFCGKVS
ncbi:hypothetical protein STCU_06413 [Strigomonas culicis]|uniref:Uncharacterized protein n=1 Tax=Strigomonas culicis TaxID=28005 RepID=S9VRR8_9TRYP|nr:hypothetical protein STCU_06413 [Strigomonas culicis]|eukprot:EPY25915.1 hypothetical protein STCU_06413 [Strigomonas culicis]